MQILLLATSCVNSSLSGKRTLPYKNKNPNVPKYSNAH